MKLLGQCLLLGFFQCNHRGNVQLECTIEFYLFLALGIFFAADILIYDRTFCRYAIVFFLQNYIYIYMFIYVYVCIYVYACIKNIKLCFFQKLFGSTEVMLLCSIPPGYTVVFQGGVPQLVKETTQPELDELPEINADEVNEEKQDAGIIVLKGFMFFLNLMICVVLEVTQDQLLVCIMFLLLPC